MRAIIPIVLFCAAVTIGGCLTGQTQADLGAKANAVATLTLKVDDLLAKIAAAEATNASNLSDLKKQLTDANAQLAAAMAELEQVRLKADAERRESAANAAAAVEAVAKDLSPTLAGVFPGAGLILGVIAGAASKVKNEMRKGA